MTSIDDSPLQGGGEHLEHLFIAAMEARGSGESVRARELFRALLKEDPRLAEPYLELSTLAGEAEDWEEAEALARTGVDLLKAGGQWTDDLAEEEMMAFALNLLGEVLMHRAEEDLMTDPEAFQGRWNEAAALFREALRHHPRDEAARRNAVHCRPLDATGKPIRG